MSIDHSHHSDPYYCYNGCYFGDRPIVDHPVVDDDDDQGWMMVHDVLVGW